MNYHVEYKDQNWIAANIEAASPAEAAQLYLRRDSEMKWQDYGEVVVFWGLFGKQSECFLIQEFLPLTPEPPEKVILGPLTQLKHRLFDGNVPEIPGQPPKVIGWFRIYTGFLCLLYLGTAAYSLYFFLADPADTEMSATAARRTGVFLLVSGLGLFGACLLPLVLRPRPWLWTYSLVLICLGMTSACILPASIPLLKWWSKPETKKYFGKA